MLAHSVPAHAGLVDCVRAMRSDDDAVELRLTTDQDGEVTTTIGTNVITFAVCADEELETGWLLIRGDSVEIDVFSGGVLTDQCTIPVDQIPRNYEPFCCDEMPPVVTVSATPKSDSGWTNETVTVTIMADDGEDGSGVEAIYYRSPALNGGNRVEVGHDRLELKQNGQVATFSLSLGRYDGNGVYNIECWAIDVADNESEAKTITVRLDFIGPTITGAPLVQPNANGWYRASVGVEFRCEDELSGIESCTGQQTLRNEGRGRSVTGEAVDKAGNREEDLVDGINIDKTEPSVSVSLSDSAVDHGESIRVTITATDGLSGINTVIATDSHLGRISLSRTGDRWQGTIQPSENGTVSVSVMDRAGNSRSTSRAYAVTQPQLPAQLEVSVTSLDFGGVIVGSSSTRTFTITNRGQATLQGSIRCTGDDCGSFSISPSTFTLDEDQQRSVTVEFHPSDRLKYIASLGIESNGGSASVRLEGIGYVGGEIAFWTTDNEWNRVAVYEEVAARFMSEYPGIEVQIVPIHEAEVSQRIATAVAAGQLPDIVRMDIERVAIFAAGGILDEDAAEAVIASIGEADFRDGPQSMVINAATGRYAAVPYDGWIQAIWYRADMFTEAGLNPPISWDDINAAVDVTCCRDSATCCTRSRSERIQGRTTLIRFSNKSPSPTTPGRSILRATSP